MTADMLEEELEAAVGAADKAPKGWEPFAEEAGAIGSAIVRLPRPNATARDLLIQAGFDPDEWQIEGNINTRRWMRYDQEWLYYYKFDVKAGESPEVVEQHIDDLVKRIRRRRSPAKPKVGGEDAFALFMSDLQIGKAENGSGTDDTVARYLDCLDQAIARIKNLRRAGHKMPHGALIGLGDIVENCVGFYPNQQFLVDRNVRDQNKIARELITTTIDEMSRLFDRMTVACIGGNHGEQRGKGLHEKITDDADNMDVSVFEAVREAFDRAGESDVDWHIPDHELSMALELGGTLVGITHGHLFGRGATIAQKAENWLAGQEMGFGPVRGCRVLVHGHWHHLLVTQVGLRTLIQAPAMDPGSAWWTNRTGNRTPPGLLTMRFDGRRPDGYDDLAILCSHDTMHV